MSHIASSYSESSLSYNDASVKESAKMQCAASASPDGGGTPPSPIMHGQMGLVEPPLDEAVSRDSDMPTHGNRSDKGREGCGPSNSEAQQAKKAVE
jgi:hypothetical protein